MVAVHSPADGGNDCKETNNKNKDEWDLASQAQLKAVEDFDGEKCKAGIKDALENGMHYNKETSINRLLIAQDYRDQTCLWVKPDSI